MDAYKKILIIQSYNPNKGDNSVISVMLQSWEKYNYQVAITAFDPDKAYNDHKINSYDCLLNLRNLKFSHNLFEFISLAILEFFWIFYSVLFLLFYQVGIHLPLPKSKKKIVDAYMSADLIVLPGGHFFTSFNSFINNFSHYYALRFAQLLGKKTMVYSQTVGPYFNSLVGRIERVLANRVLSRTNVVTLRDENSLESYSRNNAIVTAETVFIKPVPQIDIDPRKYIHNFSGEIIVGVTIHHIYYKHYFSKKEYIDLMASILDTIIETYHAQIMMIPMEDRYNTGGDRPIIEEMMSRLLSKNRPFIQMIPDDLTSDETANVISKCDIFVGTKTHSIVYGLKTATPTLSISYQRKSTEFMQLFGMGDYAIDMKFLNKKDFMIIFKNLFSGMKSVKLKLSEKIPEIQKMAEYNNILLNNLLNDK